jgi:hypothetical protein
MMPKIVIGAPESLFSIQNKLLRSHTTRWNPIRAINLVADAGFSGLMMPVAAMTARARRKSRALR